MDGVFVPVTLFSSAHCCLAPSIWRKLLMQAVAWLFERARTQLGIAMAASKPMMETTIMISTSVKPAKRDFLAAMIQVFLYVRLMLDDWKAQPNLVSHPGLSDYEQGV